MRLGRIQNDYSAAGFDLVRESGLDFIEICCNYDRDVERLVASRDAVKGEISRTGLDVSSVGRWNHEIQREGRIDPEKLALYESLLDTAVSLGAKTFVCGCNYDASVSRFKNYINAIELFGRLIERARGTGTRVAVQNCNWNNFVYSPEEWRVVLDELPELWLKFDPSHAYSRGCDYLAELSSWGERVAHFHVKGMTRVGGGRSVDDPPAGMDDLKWGSIFSILYARGYTGDLSIEPHSKTWQGELGTRGVAFTRDFIRPFIL